MTVISSPLLSQHSGAHRQVQEEVVAVQHRESRLMLQPLGQVLDELGGEVVAEAGHEAAAAGEGGHAVKDGDDAVLLLLPTRDDIVRRYAHEAHQGTLD